MTLDKLEIGMSASIVSVNGEESLRHHLLDMGLIPETKVTLIKKAPMGDPIQLKIRDYVLTIRLNDAACIDINNIHKYDKNIGKKDLIQRHKYLKHPGVGEENRYRTKRIGRVLKENEKLTFALVGNQNCGKTTLFNQLTGANQHVGNFPGVTVDRKDGVIRKHPNAVVTDLPGIYSLSPYSNEEMVTREFLLKNRPRGIINIIDATNIERNMYLTMQLIELNIPMVLALNMMDEVRANGGTVLVNKLEAELGIPVVPIAASLNEGVDELIEHAVRMARYRERPGRMDFCDSSGSANDQAVHRCIHAIKHTIDDHARASKIPIRFAASKLVENDTPILDSLNLEQNEKEIIEHIVEQLEEESSLDRVAALAQMRFNFIDRICSETVIKPRESKEHKRSLMVDKVLTGKVTGIPAFLGIMGLMFYMTFGLIGPLLSTGLEYLITYGTSVIDNALTTYQMNEVVHSLIIDGIFAGVGSVLSFLPIIVVLFFFLSIMEDSGYMARVAFIMDKPLRKIGLSGRSFVPMLIGFGCSVPAIMATRTLSSNRDRKMTILLIPFMSCSAKLPIYAFITMAFFKEYRTLVIIVLYLLGLLAGILYAYVMRNSLFKGEPIPFVMELPNYRMPSIKSVALLIWDKSRDFINKAFTIIFVASIIIWFLQSFDMRFNIVSDSSQSLLAMIGGVIAPIFAPLGLNDWKISTALITGFVAKESVVSTITVLLGSDGNLNELLNTFTAFVFLVFTLYYTPCVAAIAAVKREFSTKWAAVIVAISQCVVAWILAFIVHAIGSLII